MAWFSRQSPGEDPVQPLSQARLTEILDGQGWHWTVDEDGDLGGVWDGNTFYFLISGDHDEILQVAGYLGAHVPGDSRDALRVFIEDWHRDHYWPKCYFLEDPEDSTLRLVGSVTVDYEHGVTQAQLFQHVKCALGTISQTFDDVVDALGLRPRDDQRG